MPVPPDVEVISISSGSDSSEDEDAQNGHATPSDGSADELDAPYALDNASRTQLQVAIATVPEQRVREAFAALVDSVPAVTERVFRMLVAMQPVPVKGEEEEDEEEDDDDDAEEEEHSALGVHDRVMLVPRWQICAKCNEEFDAGTPRRRGECMYHPGFLEVNERMFVDWDEDCHGPMDTRENREQYPENFIWSCCEGDGRSIGCVQDAHEPEQAQDRRKRARHW